MKVPGGHEFWQNTIQPSTVLLLGFPGDTVVKNRLADVGNSADLGLILWVGKIHSSILAQKNPMDRGAWWATVHGVAKSQTGRQDGVTENTHTHTPSCYRKRLGHLPEMQEKQREALRSVLFHRGLQGRERMMVVVVVLRPISEIYQKKKEPKVEGR